MKKTCLGLMVAIMMINPACLFAQEEITPAYLRFKDFTPAHGSPDTSLGKDPDPTIYYPIPVRFSPFKDYPSPDKTAEELIMSIQEKLNKADSSMVGLAFDDSTGNVIIRYAQSGRGWIINVRDIKPEDFIWKKGGDTSSVRLGKMGSRKFHCANEQDAQDIEAAFARIRVMNGWMPSAS